MSAESDIQTIISQEQNLVFERFDEDVAFAVGAAVRDGAKKLNKGGIAVGVYLWDRTMFYGATAGVVEGNRNWIERKAKLTRMSLKSTYRYALERGDKGRILEPNWGLDPKDYAIAGGSFPIAMRGIGVVGAAVASGLHERDDHELVRSAIAVVLGKPADYLALQT